MSDKLKPGAIEVREDHEPMAPISGPWYSAAAERQSLHRGDAEADAAQLNAALAVVERVKALLAKTQTWGHDAIGRPGYTLANVARVLLEPDDAKRAMLPGAEWLGGET